ncbi:hypothetical protein ES702_03064 [subsurface metagenome]
MLKWEWQVIGHSETPLVLGRVTDASFCSRLFIRSEFHCRSYHGWQENGYKFTVRNDRDIDFPRAENIDLHSFRTVHRIDDASCCAEHARELSPLC